MGLCFSCSKRLTKETTKVVELEDQRQYDKQLAAAADGDRLTVVEFTGKWCGPCRAMGPFLDTMSLKYPQVKFLKVDIDKDPLRQIVQKSLITGVPTFEFIKNRKVVDRFVGSNILKLESRVQQLSEDAQPSSLQI